MWARVIQCGVCLLLVACPTYRQQVFVFDSDVEWNWMVIEWSNPNCPALPGGRTQTIRIPSDGDVCTSTAHPDMFNASYFASQDGKLRELLPPAERVEQSGIWEKEGRRLTFINWASRNGARPDTSELAIERHFKKFP